MPDVASVTHLTCLPGWSMRFGEDENIYLVEEVAILHLVWLSWINGTIISLCCVFLCCCVFVAHFMFKDAFSILLHSSRTCRNIQFGEVVKLVDHLYLLVSLFPDSQISLLLIWCVKHDLCMMLNKYQTFTFLSTSYWRWSTGLICPACQAKLDFSAEVLGTIHAWVSGRP